MGKENKREKKKADRNRLFQRCWKKDHSLSWWRIKKANGKGREMEEGKKPRPLSQVRGGEGGREGGYMRWPAVFCSGGGKPPFS